MRKTKQANFSLYPYEKQVITEGAKKSRLSRSRYVSLAVLAYFVAHDGHLPKRDYIRGQRNLPGL